ncbi:rRNA maturation RNase YbeY [Microbulbifer sp. GL-2]|uniref:rRNA maturation RNase YbeY n=1 Tax=Microbulbifer sp. GL-2 TaxID=2591606 RepID=UPI00116492BD|nr:rRNA maturation RNase YbeY [Microbulbifer sp. GL-2]BBM02210.1 endoribonuclease YbeY [Microbulbifer sp. GL-2]
MIDLTLDVQRASRCTYLPSDDDIRSWVIAALPAHRKEVELAVRIVDEDESQQLNHQYRGKDKPTNVLSFHTDFPAELNLPLLGDLVICAPIVQMEADQQGKSLPAHWAHMLVHGTLHLLGYDHIDDAEAEVMEQLETKLLAQLGFADPYTPLEEAG